MTFTYSMLNLVGFLLDYCLMIWGSFPKAFVPIVLVA